MEKYIQNDALRHHCKMVATSMAAYAHTLGEDEELWYQTGLLHDLDWEMYPDEHPHKAVQEWLTDYPDELRNAILAHGPERTGRYPETALEKYLFACDEVSGFLYAYSLMRPERFAGMSAGKARKKLKDRSFAANVSREDIETGFELIDVDPVQHLQFLIAVYAEM
jgi:putative nucleotidyltransferase with HDIG domain